MSIYFDNAATTAVSEAAKKAAFEVLEAGPGNPSSGHTSGRRAKDRLRKARLQAAALLNADESEVFFTSGGTESNCTAILGAVKRAGQRAVTSAAEHPSVLACFKEIGDRGVEVVYLTPNKDGEISVKNVLADFVSLMHVNNETGVVTDIEKLCKTTKGTKGAEKDCLFHVDAVQGFGKIPIDVKKWGVDLVSVSAHKMHGMGGVGALYVRKGVLPRLKPLVLGGGQESGLRSGTENLAGICAFGVACEEAGKNMTETLGHVKSIKNRLLRIPDEIQGAVINGLNTSPYIINISFPGVNSEVLQSALDSRGIYISAGAACSSGKKEPKNAVSSYGLGKERAESSVRISIGRYNTAEEAEILIAALKELVPALKHFRR